jgi:hypothetical protein
VGRIPRTKGSKNKKTLLKEQKIQKIVSEKIKTTGKPVVAESIVIPEEPKQRMALRLFTLEKKVHDDFIKHISQLGDPTLYESYIVNEIMTKYLNGKIKLPKADPDRLREYMWAYGHVGLEPGTKVDEMDEFKAANRLIHRTTTSFIQYQYPIIVDPDIKTSINNPSYTINECLKLYMNGNIKVDIRDFRVREWEPRFRYILKKKFKDEK